MITVGITGRSGSGKSSLSSLLLKKGYPVADGDEISRVVTYPQSPCVQELVAEFGETIVDEKGTLQRRRLAEIAFATPQRTVSLNNIVHPYIMREFEKQKTVASKQGAKLNFLDGAAILDSPFEKHCQKIVAVIADEKLAIMRIVLRDGISKVAAEKRLKVQVSLDTLKAKADFIITNNGSEASFAEEVNLLETRLLEIAAAPG